MATCKSDGFDLLNPSPRVTKILFGKQPTECEQRRAACALKHDDEQKVRLMNLIWKEDAAAHEPVREVFWMVSAPCADNNVKVRVRTSINTWDACNLIAPETVAHLHLMKSPLDTPVPHTHLVGGVDTVSLMTEYVRLKLSTLLYEYTTKDIIALIMPDINILSTQVSLGTPFLKDNRLTFDNVSGMVCCPASGTMLVEEAEVINTKETATNRKLPKASRERVTPRSVLASVCERVEVLSTQQELIDRGEKRRFPQTFRRIAAQFGLAYQCLLPDKTEVHRGDYKNAVLQKP